MVDWTDADLTEEEIAQLWRETPIMAITKRDHDKLRADLEREARVVPEILELIKKAKKTSRG